MRSICDTMRKAALIVGIALFLGAIAAAIVPMWTATSGLELSGTALAAVIFMVLGCFAIGGGLMFLIFYSARHGYDDRVHLDRPRGPDNERE
jgi:hypothetical protein